MKSQIALPKYSPQLSEILLILRALTPSSAGVERVFSTMGHIRSGTRNRLSTLKATKLIFVLIVLIT